MSVRVTQHKRGWWMVDIRVREPSGKQLRDRKKAPVTSRSAAQRWGEARERHLSQHGNQEVQAVPTLGAFYPRYLALHVVANNLKASYRTSVESIYRTHLAPTLGAKRLDEISTEDVQAIKLGIAGREPKTVNNILGVLSGIFTAAVEWGAVKTRPAIGFVKVPDAELSFYEDDVLDRLIAAAEKVDPRCLLIVLLGADAGFRAGEMIGLEWGDVDVRRAQVRVRRSEVRGITDTPKGTTSRRLDMTPRLLAALKDVRHAAGDRVLRRTDGKPVSWAWLRDRVKAAERIGGGVDVTGNLHVLRHTFCSRLAMAGVPARTIQALADHKSITTTEKYMHLSPLAKGNAILVLDRGNIGATPEKKKATLG